MITGSPPPALDLERIIQLHMQIRRAHSSVLGTGELEYLESCLVRREAAEICDSSRSHILRDKRRSTATPLATGREALLARDFLDRSNHFGRLLAVVLIFGA